MRGKAVSQSVVIPTRCTPWPGKKRAVRGRFLGGGVVEAWRWGWVCGCWDVVLAVVYIAGRRVGGSERRDVEGWVRRRAERDIAPGVEGGGQ